MDFDSIFSIAFRLFLLVDSQSFAGTATRDFEQGVDSSIRDLVSYASVATSQLDAASAVDLVGGNGVLAVASGIHSSGGGGGGSGGTATITLRHQAARIAAVSTGSVRGHLLVDDARNTTIATTISSSVAVHGASVDVGEQGEGNKDDLGIE